MLSSDDEMPRGPRVIKVTHDLCYEHAGKLTDKVLSLLTEPTHAIALDLSEVCVIDSSGLRTLLQSRKLCEEAGVTLTIGRASECVVRIIHMSQLNGVFGLPKGSWRDRRKQSAAKPGRSDEMPSIPDTERKVYEFVAASEARVISVLREKVMQIAAEAGADGDALVDIQIAAGEALTNAYKHGSPDPDSNNIQLRCWWCANAVGIEIQDEGHPFDPNATPEPDPENHPRDHGMGIYLMRQAMDCVEFDCDCPGNRVRMVKWLNGNRHRTSS